MKMLVRVVCMLAIANMLALVGLVGYLAGTGRLNAERARLVRETFQPTIAEQAEADEAEAEELRAQEASQMVEAAGPPLTAGERLELRLEQTELERQRADRLRREVEDLQRTLAVERRRLDLEREALLADRASFNAEREEIAQTEGQAQFKRALETLQGLKASEARLALEEIISGAVAIYTSDSGRDTSPEAGLNQAVAYLNAMDDRQRTKIIAEFLKDQPELAARLLERIRTRGVVARGAGDQPG